MNHFSRLFPVREVVPTSFYCLDKYSTDVPEVISKKIALFYEQDSKIANMKSQLNDLRARLENLEKEHRWLRKELKPYSIPPEKPSNNLKFGTNQVNTVLHIDRLPHDILYMVFKIYLEYDHHDIWKLASVSRGWNRFIMDCPGLWAQIQITTDTDHPIQYSFQHPLSYISACLERSQDLPLDISLRFDGFPTPDDSIQTTLTDTDGAVIDTSDIENLVDPSWGWDLDFDSPSYCWLFNRFFDRLVGINGQRMTRWSRLYIDVGYDRPLSASILKRLRGPLPNLKHLNMQGFPRTGDDEHDTTFFSQGLTDLSAVTSLKLWETPPLTSFPLSDSNLRHVDLWFNESFADLVPLSIFSRLQTLSLYGDREEEIGPPVNPLPTICLPNLEELTLSGFYSPLSDLTFDLPKLKRLVLYTDREGTMVLPDLSPEYIDWIALGWNGIDVKKIFESLLALSRNVKSITLSDEHVRWMVLNEIERLREDGSLTSLPQVYITS